MLTLHKGNGIQTPFEVSLFDGDQPRAGEASALQLRFYCEDNDYLFDFSQQQFKDPAVFSHTDVHAFRNPQQGSRNYLYSYLYDVGAWPRGHYLCEVVHTITDEVWLTPFTVGLYVPQQLRYAATWSADSLHVSLWVESNGAVQTDVSQVSNPTLRDRTGAVIWTDDQISNTSHTNGVFYLQVPAALQPNTSYVFDADFHFPGGQDVSDFVHTMRFGMARP